jgi:prepilin-type N-terminal cleavage/methylation domain-containing protein
MMVATRPIQSRRGFTFIELMMVITLLAMLSIFAVPMNRDGSSLRVKAAATLLRSDLERAQIMAIAHPDQRIGLQLDASGWSLVDADAAGPPLRDEFTGYPITLTLGSGRGQFAQGVQLESSELVIFNPLGGLWQPGPTKRLLLRCNDDTAVVRISPSTGWISIDP